MSMIILDHLLLYVNFPFKAIVIQFGNLGVLIFLFISGYLYGNKEIIDWKKWFLNRVYRICIPMWIFMIIDFIIEYLLWDTINCKYIVIYAFNLQGILGTNIGGGTLWFLTLLMFCYLITPILHRISQRQTNIFWLILVTGIVIAIQVISAYLTNVGMVAAHPLSWCIVAVGVYTIGYLWGNIILCDDLKIKKLILWTVAAIAAGGVICVFRMKFDGHIIYDRVVFYYGEIVLTLWGCVVLYKIGSYIKKGLLLSFINFLDKYSYDIYIVHCLIFTILIDRVFNLYGLLPYLICSIIWLIVCAMMLHYLCDIVYKNINR